MEKISKNFYANRCGSKLDLGLAVEICVNVFGCESCGLEAPMVDMELESLRLFPWWYKGGYCLVVEERVDIMACTNECGRCPQF